MTDAMAPGVGSLANSTPRPMMVVDDAHVTYKVYAGGKPVGSRSKLFGQRGGNVNEVHALRGVSFTASEGETVGVIGHNGSGKSTLFRAMAGLIPTTAGTIKAADRPVLLGVNAALMPALSGENNIKLGLLAMGFTSEEAAAHVDEIAEFAELNEFISHPMRTYSSGMGARLRFAIASARPHSILLLDEALAVGDRRFRLKSEERIRGLRDAAGLVMIVSHSAGSLKDTCERGLWIHKGELLADGPINDVVDEYTKWTKDPTSVAVGAASAPKQPVRPATAPLPQTTVGMSTAQLKATEANPRAIARRKRFIAATQQRTRRRRLAIWLTAAGVVLAVGAGAAIALLSRQSDRIEIDELRTAASSSPPTTAPPTPTSTPQLPIVHSFVGQPTVACESVDATIDVSLDWSVTNAASLWITTPAADGSATTLLENQPLEAHGQLLPFSCDVDSRSYTLVTSSATGQQVTSTVVITRELAVVDDEPGADDSSREGAPVEPLPPVTEPPAPDPAPVEPTIPPVEPTVEPTPEPAPTDPPIDEPTPEPTPTDPPVVEPTP